MSQCILFGTARDSKHNPINHYEWVQDDKGAKNSKILILMKKSVQGSNLYMFHLYMFHVLCDDFPKSILWWAMSIMLVTYTVLAIKNQYN